ncbi:SNF1-related protein kinase [Hibiscus syriacus]|uniref:SNF1-related protein kinase n=1 Tax=Hibiscus syriacus TaxID=106335 RepID=A0A6A2XRI9_HIBSY|nr:SNF1-related protein kinase [Hibiscus syriacus]
MSEVFEGYERQYCELSASLSKKCTAASAVNGEQKKQKLSDVKSGLEDAEAIVPDLNNLKSEVKRIASGNLNPSARDELLEMMCVLVTQLHGVDDNIGKSKRILTYIEEDEPEQVDHRYHYVPPRRCCHRRFVLQTF